ncbi:MAG: S41 family peptidase [Planctomycetes bacterium]|nr:S41 family peptidase [Planctomycetota bacterium]
MRLLLNFAVPLLLLANPARTQTKEGEASPEATRYLEDVLDRIESGSRMQATDWKALRAKAKATIDAAGAATTAATYPAIREALAALGDKHSFLLEPAAAKSLAAGRAEKATGLFVVHPDAVVAQVVPGSPAAAAGLALGDRIVEVVGVDAFGDLPRREFGRLFRSGLRRDGSTATLDLRVQTGTAPRRAVQVSLADFDEYLPPTGRLLDGGIAYLELPGLGGGPKAATYDDTVHELLGQIDGGTLRGCIVDLRRNTGGNMWPMLAGIGPLAGDGKVGSFVSANGSTDWSYDAARGAAKSGDHELARVKQPQPLRADLPVALLTGSMTASSGEAVVVAFAGRARTRRFGEATRGVPTANASQPLADGALLVLTVSVDADRTGKTYDDVILPDEKVAIDWMRFGTADDPVLAAACRWLAAAADAK